MQSSTKKPGPTPLTAEQKEQTYAVFCLWALIAAVGVLVGMVVLLSNHEIHLVGGLLMGGISCWSSAVGLVWLIGWKYRTYPEKGLGDQPTPNWLSGLILWTAVIGCVLLAWTLMAALTW